MRRIVFVCSLLILGLFLASPAAAGSRPPYTTWALGPGGRLYLTQDAYIPVVEIDLPLSGPEDLFITSEGIIYIADAGNGRVVRLGTDVTIEATYGEGILKSPTGVFVDDEGTIYVADAGNKMVFIFSPDGLLEAQFGRPTDPLFGRNNSFLPRKIAVDARRNLYVVSEGSTNGLVMLSRKGDFMGYFGANPAVMSLKMMLQRIFLTREQLAQFIRNEAASPSNVAIDPESMVFTVTAGTARQRSIRRFTVAGRNIFPEVYGSTSFRDIHISEGGLVTAVDAEGQIYEYDLKGTLLFVFGARDPGDSRLGTLRNPTGIARHEDRLYVLDRDKNAVVVYQATRFARLVHEGVRWYVEGFYTQARPYFEEVLRYNGSFIMAYQAIADVYFKERDYVHALRYYRYAEDRRGYSEAFWELRNVVLQRYLSPAILALLGLVMAQSVVGRLDRRYGLLEPIRRRWSAWRKLRLVDDFLFLFRFICHPADSFYYIKEKEHSSLRFALLLYLWVVVVRVTSLYLTGFVFNPYADPSRIRAEVEVVYVLVLVLLWNSANYLVSTISDGEGRLRDVVIGTAYALFPYALFALPLTLLSNLMTLNETFLYTFPRNLIWAWTGLMLFIMVREIHNYSFSETVRNVLTTLFTMAMMVLTAYLLYILFYQLADFVTAVYRELRLRG